MHPSAKKKKYERHACAAKRQFGSLNFMKNEDTILFLSILKI